MPEIQYLYANCPCYPILDDHEIVDDWGTERKHLGAGFLRVKKGARQAYVDYQGLLVSDRKARLPSSFHYSFEYGSVGVFVFDLRSERRGGRRKDWQLIGRRQMAAFERFLRASQAKRVLLIVASVPIVHVPEWLADIGGLLLGDVADLKDQWSYKHNRPMRNKVLRLIREHQRANPDQKVMLVSGDVHIGVAFRVDWQGAGAVPALYQLTSSAVSNRTKKRLLRAVQIPPKIASEISSGRTLLAKTRLLESAGAGAAGRNPFAGPNIGIVQIENGARDPSATFRLVTYTADTTDQYE
jgi:alkaline phosphatase D